MEKQWHEKTYTERAREHVAETRNVLQTLLTS